MRKFEAVGLILVFSLIIYRLLVGVGLQFFLTIIIPVLSVFYMWFGFFLFNRMRFKDLFDKEKRKELNTLQIVSSITAGFIYSFSFITLIFAMGFHPGMNMMISMSLLFNVVILGFSIFFFITFKDKRRFVRQFLFRSVVLSAIFFFLWYTPVEKRLGFFYKDYPEFVNAYIDYLENPDDPEVQKRLSDERSAFR
jgi:hypothetical protein